jgi:hypothetical protein
MPNSGGRRLIAAFVELRRETINYVRSVRPSVWEDRTPSARFFLKKFDTWEFCKKSVTKIQVSLQTNKTNSPDSSIRLQEFEAPRSQDNWHMKVVTLVVRLSALRTDRL